MQDSKQPGNKQKHPNLEFQIHEGWVFAVFFMLLVFTLVTEYVK